MKYIVKYMLNVLKPQKMKGLNCVDNFKMFSLDIG